MGQSGGFSPLLPARTLPLCLLLIEIQCCHLSGTSRQPVISLECVEHTLLMYPAVLPSCCPLVLSFCAPSLDLDLSCLCLFILCLTPGLSRGFPGRFTGLIQPLSDTNKSKHDKTIETFSIFTFECVCILLHFAFVFGVRVSPLPSPSASFYSFFHTPLPLHPLSGVELAVEL